jgi:nucleotide-binding universal stress UspA family protein
MLMNDKVQTTMFAKILVAYDGSPHAQWALLKAIEIGKIDKSEITVYHSVQHYFRTVKLNTFFPLLGSSSMKEDNMGISLDAEAAVFRSQMAIGERLLAEAKKKVEDAGLKCAVELIENQGPVEAAKHLVETKGMDLVVVGARGVHNAVERVLLGSVSSGIVNSVCSNIMIMRSECDASHGPVAAEQPKKVKVKGKA